MTLVTPFYIYHQQIDSMHEMEKGIFDDLERIKRKKLQLKDKTN